MKVELFALWELLFVMNTLRKEKFQLLGDSMTMVYWVKGKVQIQVSGINHLMRQICAFFYVLE
jgi:hypothetical protein